MQTIGERLEEARKRKGISIREAAEATKIRGDYLQKFEGNQFDIGLSDIYVRGFLRTYCNLLKLPHERIIADLRLSGHGAEAKKAPSREIYGRMDISIASANGKPQKSEALPDLGSEEEEAPSGTMKRTFAKIGTSLPSGTFIDQKAIKKILLIVCSVIVAALLIWLLVSTFMEGKRGPSVQPQTTTQLETEPTIGLIALENVEVTVQRKDDGVTLFSGLIPKGEQRSVSKTGALYISANKCESLLVEIKGKRYNMPGNLRGQGRCEIR